MVFKMELTCSLTGLTKRTIFFFFPQCEWLVRPKTTVQGDTRNNMKKRLHLTNRVWLFSWCFILQPFLLGITLVVSILKSCRGREINKNAHVKTDWESFCILSGYFNLDNLYSYLVG